MVNATKVAISQQDRHPADAAHSTSAPCGRAAPARATPATRSSLYDELANRWLLSQFATPNHLCFAISQTAEPARQLPPVHVQRRIVPRLLQGRRLAERLLRLRQRVDLHGLRLRPHEDARRRPDRGLRQVHRRRPTSCCPADVDGPTAPAAGGGLFYTFKDNSFHGGADRIELFRLHAELRHPGEQHVHAREDVPDRALHLHGLRLLQLQLHPPAGHRRSGSTRSASGRCTASPTATSPTTRAWSATSPSAAATARSARRSAGSSCATSDRVGGWTLFQEGTHDPGDGHDRFMGSIAMDEDGNIALGYSVSSSTLFPAIRYATRAARRPARDPGAREDAAGRERLADRLEPLGRLQRDVRRPGDRLPVLVHERVLQPELGDELEDRVGAFTMPGCT